MLKTDVAVGTNLVSYLLTEVALGLDQASLFGRAYAAEGAVMLDGLLPWLPGFAAAYAIQVVAVASPGPGVALLLGLGLSRGRTSALAASLGIAVGAACLALATTLGLGLVMERVAWLSTGIRVAGACYLMWLAVKAWKRAFIPPTIEIATASGAGGFVRSIGVGLAMQLPTPKP